MKTTTYETTDGKTLEVRTYGTTAEVYINDVKVNTDEIVHAPNEDEGPYEYDLIGLFLGGKVATTVRLKPHLARRIAIQLRRTL